MHCDGFSAKMILHIRYQAVLNFSSIFVQPMGNFAENLDIGKRTLLSWSQCVGCKAIQILNKYLFMSLFHFSIKDFVDKKSYIQHEKKKRHIAPLTKPINKYMVNLFLKEVMTRKFKLFATCIIFVYELQETKTRKPKVIYFS